MRHKRAWLGFAIAIGLLWTVASLPVTWAAPEQNALRQSVPTLTPIGGLPTLPPLPTELPTVIVPTVELPTAVLPTVDLPTITITVPPILATATPIPATIGTATPSASAITPTLGLTATATLEAMTPTQTPIPTEAPSESVATEETSTLEPTVAPESADEGQRSLVVPMLLGGGALMLLGVGLFIFARRRRGGSTP